MSKLKSRLSLSWVFLLQILADFSWTIAAIRKEIGFPDRRICRTTVQGRYLLADDNGYVCDALSLDPQSRCCPERGVKFSCHGCNVLSQCCNCYEFCVSCCLNPAQTQKEQVLKLKIAKPSTSGTYVSVFDFCAGRCRHNSESVVHENAYVSDFHHCFSLPSDSSGKAMEKKGEEYKLNESELAERVKKLKNELGKELIRSEAKPMLGAGKGKLRVEGAGSDEEQSLTVLPDLSANH